ncbi:MAG: glycosyltransferase [Acetobacteraceae bacterium]|nr:glycosyltransferase [Acetobacteraceae bacterium]
MADGGDRCRIVSCGRRERAVLIAGRLWDEGKNAAALDRIAPALDAPVRAAGPVRGPNGAAIDLHNLHLLGTLDALAMAEAYASATVYASMARYEPFGLSVLEAARAGLRLVLADIPSLRELWDGAASFVREEPELLPALAAALRAEGDGGAQSRAARYTVDAMVEGTLAVHRAVGALA